MPPSRKPGMQSSRSQSQHFPTPVQVEPSTAGKRSSARSSPPNGSAVGSTRRRDFRFVTPKEAIDSQPSSAPGSAGKVLREAAAIRDAGGAEAGGGGRGVAEQQYDASRVFNYRDHYPASVGTNTSCNVSVGLGGVALSADKRNGPSSYPVSSAGRSPAIGLRLLREAQAQIAADAAEKSGLLAQA